MNVYYLMNEGCARANPKSAFSPTAPTQLTSFRIGLFSFTKDCAQNCVPYRYSPGYRGSAAVETIHSRKKNSYNQKYEAMILSCSHDE